MAKLGSYYGLCPLIDHKSLLGVSEDITPGCVIVTLGKNMAIKYKLSDQKQIHCWSTKEKLSSPVLYDKKGQRYVAVFNLSYIRLWNEDENLEKIKKIKFSVAIHTLIKSDEEPIVVFKNGLVLLLSIALENRKELPECSLVDKMTSIEDQTILKVEDRYFVGLFLKNDSEYSYLWISVDTQTSRKIYLKRMGLILNGHLAMITETGPTLFTLWSDGRLFTHDLKNEVPEHFYSVVEYLSRKQPVCMIALNMTYIAMYGAEPSQEGASLQIYNTQFKVTQSKTQLKLFTLGSKLWLIEDCILLTIGQNLAVVPFYVATEQLAALVGSHQNRIKDDEISIISEITVEDGWETDVEIDEKQIFTTKMSNKKIVTDLMKEGCSEVEICGEIFPKLMEKQDISTISNCINVFTDIPEAVTINLLSFCLKQIMKTAMNTEISFEKLGRRLSRLLDKILTIPYSDVLLLPHLRSGLKLDEVILFLQYLCYLLSEKGHDLPPLDSTQSEEKVMDWGCLVLDAHYQQLLLSKDAKIIEYLNYFKALIDAYSLCMDDYKKLHPVLFQLKKGKKSGKLLNTGSVKYSVEKLKLY